MSQALLKSVVLEFLILEGGAARDRIVRNDKVDQIKYLIPLQLIFSGDSKNYK